jgi:hypothetical protein
MNGEKLLTRDEFREGVFKRDNFTCIFCSNPAKDAHHILERRLFNDGGYYLNNGASVCEEHHLACEMTLISVEEVREKAGITKPVIPDQLYDGEIYTKWGDLVLPNGQRTKGELFYDESVQKILKTGGVLNLYTDYVKYPRTFHLPFSPGMHDDDKAWKTCENFEGKRVIVTEKLDGEQTSMYRDYIHARSIDGRSHPSRDWVKNFWSTIAHEIPEGWRLCGENVFAKHSIGYSNLESYFYGFSIWDQRNVCLSWDDTALWFDLLGIKIPPVLFDGIWDEKIIKGLYNEKTMYDTVEGFVVRLADSYSYSNFKNSVAKYVRKGHVQTTKHWFFGQAVEPNKLGESK